MNKKPVGRPINPNALQRTGQRYLLWLSKKDSTKLKRIARENQVAIAEIIRRLIREFILENYKECKNDSECKD